MAETNGYITFDVKNKNKVISNYKNVNSFDSITKKKEHYLTAALTDIVSTRSPFSKSEYLSQRPCDALPSSFEDIISACRSVYLRVGIIRNVINLMTDFASEDLDLVHTDKKVEAFFKVWKNKVKLKDAVDEFIRHLLIDGNVVVRRITATLTKPVERDWLDKTMASDIKVYKEANVLNKREIPYQYTFLNILGLEWLSDGDDEKLLAPKRLAYRLSKNITTILNDPKSPFCRKLTDKIPQAVIKQAKDGTHIEIDMNKVYVAYHKKDSWDNWAPPILYSVLSDLHYKDKLRQAEIAVTDGTINPVRIWKLGDHTKEILPSEAAIDRLKDILENNTGGGSMDIVWDSMIDMKDYYPPVDKILNSEKYKEVDKDILIALGVPNVLIGGDGANFSNSFIQLKTLVEKLKYIRGIVKDWLDSEINFVCRSMDIAVAPKVKFGQMNLDDENSQKKLILGLFDRNIISAEAVVKAYGEDFLVEMERMEGEKQVFKSAGIEKLSPLKKPDISTGQNGRPPGANDSSKRATRNPKIRTSAQLMDFGLEALEYIDEKVMPVYLRDRGMMNARKLTSEQKAEVDNCRLMALSCISHTDDLSENILDNITEDRINYKLLDVVESKTKEFLSQKGKTPSISQKRRLEALAWSELQGV